MRRLALAAGLVAAASVAAAGDTWGPMSDALPPGTAVCNDDGERIVCAVLMCEDGRLTFGVFGTGHDGELEPTKGDVSVDGESVERRMQSRIIGDNFLHIRTPIAANEPLYGRLRAGSEVEISIRAARIKEAYPLKGTSDEFARVSEECR